MITVPGAAPITAIDPSQPVATKDLEDSVRIGRNVQVRSSAGNWVSGDDPDLGDPVSTERAGHGRDLAREAAETGRPLIVSVSGDGGCNDVVG